MTHMHKGKRASTRKLHTESTDGKLYELGFARCQVACMRKQHGSWAAAVYRPCATLCSFAWRAITMTPSSTASSRTTWPKGGTPQAPVLVSAERAMLRGAVVLMSGSCPCVTHLNLFTYIITCP